jgi:hypothetical protein
MRDVERATPVTDLAKIRGVELAIIVVCCRLVEIVFGVGPVPFVAAVGGPVVFTIGELAFPILAFLLE